MFGKVASFLGAAHLNDAERAALDHGQAQRRGQSYTLRINASPTVHHQLPGRPAQAHREYAKRVNALPAATP